MPLSAQDAANDTRTVAVPPTGNAEIDKYNAEYLLLTRTLMSAKSVSDTFGKRIAQRYVAMQLTVANRNSEFQWLITDGAIDLKRLIQHMESTSACQPKVATLAKLLNNANGSPANTITGEDLTSLRGVAEKGQSLDTRNLTFRLLRGSGTIAAGLLSVATFGPAFAPGVAAFNGPLMTAYETMFPDYTVNQLNRLNDEAYAANTVVGKHQAKVMVVFIPMSMLLDKDEQKQYYQNPHAIFESPCMDLRLLDASVDGHYVTQLDLTPIVTGVTIDAAEAAKFGTDNFKVAGTVVGRFLDKATLSLSGAPEGLVIAPKGAGTDTRIGFELSSPKALSPNAPFTIVIKKEGLTATNFSMSAGFSPQRPSIATDGVAPKSVTQEDKSKTITITGTGFLPGSSVVFENGEKLNRANTKVVSTTTLTFEVTVEADATPGNRKFWVDTAGGRSDESFLEIVKKQRPPVLTNATVTETEQAKFGTDNFKVTGFLTGRFLVDATLSVKDAPPGVTIAPDGERTEERAGFVLSSPRAIQPGSFTILASKPGLADGSRVFEAKHTLSKPTITAGKISPTSIKQGETTKVTIGGTGFALGAVADFTNKSGLTVTTDPSSTLTSLVLNVQVDADAAPGARKLSIKVGTLESTPGEITITKK